MYASYYLELKELWEKALKDEELKPNPDLNYIIKARYEIAELNQLIDNEG